MPTVVVFLGCISIHAAVYSSSPLSWVDVMGAGVTALAILIEAVAVSVYNSDIHNIMV